MSVTGDNIPQLTLYIFSSFFLYFVAGFYIQSSEWYNWFPFHYNVFLIKFLVSVTYFK